MAFWSFLPDVPKPGCFGPHAPPGALFLSATLPTSTSPRPPTLHRPPPQPQLDQLTDPYTHLSLLHLPPSPLFFGGSLPQPLHLPLDVFFFFKQYEGNSAPRAWLDNIFLPPPHPFFRVFMVRLASNQTPNTHLLYHQPHTNLQLNPLDFFFSPHFRSVKPFLRMLLSNFGFLSSHQTLRAIDPFAPSFQMGYPLSLVNTTFVVFAYSGFPSPCQENKLFLLSTCFFPHRFFPSLFSPKIQVFFKVP